MWQMIQWEYNGDPRAAQYSEALKDYLTIDDSQRSRAELKKILLFLAGEYKKNLNDQKKISLIYIDIDLFYRFLNVEEKAEYQKLLVKLEKKNNG